MPFDVTCGNHEHTEKYMHACKWSKNVALGVVYQWHCRFLIYLLIWESKHFKRQFNFQRNKRVKTPEISLADVPWQFYTLFPHADGPYLWSHPPVSLWFCVFSCCKREVQFSFGKRKLYCYSMVNSTTNTNFSVHNYKKSTIDMKILFPDMKIKYTTSPIIHL